MTDPGRWERVRRVFLGALEREGEAREAYLREACGEDAAVRDEVDGLLRSSEGAGALEPVVSLDEVLEGGGAEPLFTPGDRIDKYEVGRLLNSGGMGEVYLATRVDDYRDQVAIKVMRRGLESTGMVRRFQRERQMLALLDHPNISRLLDGGTTPSGLPYLVMEYIDGGMITEYCREHGLSTRQVVALLLGACDAIRCAHRNLVVHRDIKPGNMLITREGVLKLLDFGIASLVEAGPGGRLAGTATAPAAMTLRYSSPEQILGQPVTTATDVYSLGLVLYELLAGRPAYEVEGIPRYESERMICEVDPPAPSVVRRRGGGEHRGVEIPQDLDDIVMMAIRKAPGARYTSVEALSEDLERFLSGEAVLAHRDSFAYRARKYVSRHRTGVAFVAFGVLLTAGAVASTSVGMARARSAAALAKRERDDAVHAREEAEGVQQFLETMLASSSPFAQEGDVSVYDLLQSADTLIRTRLADQPDVAARVHAAIGRVHLGLFQYEAAIPHLRAALEHDRAAQDVDELRLADGLSKLARAKSDLVFTREVDCRDVVDMQLEALEIRRRALGGEHPLVAETLADLALAHWSQAPDAPASDRVIELYEESLAMFERLGVTASAELAETSLGAGHAYFSRGEIEPAGRWYLRSVEIYRDDPELTSQFTLNALNAYASYLRHLGRCDEAVTVYDESIELSPSQVLLASTLEAAWERLLCRIGAVDERELGGEIVEAVRLQAARLREAFPSSAPELDELAARVGDGEAGDGGEVIGAALPVFARACDSDPARFGEVLARIVRVGAQLRGGAWMAGEIESCLAALAPGSAGVEEALRRGLGWLEAADQGAP
ncbi:MAG: serine/threonine-protein kinase [Phycisphaerales bacterium]